MLFSRIQRIKVGQISVHHCFAGSVIAFGVLSMDLACSLQEISYLESGSTKSPASGGQVSSGGAAGTSAVSSGGSNNGVGGSSTSASGGAIATTVEPDLERPLLSCGAVPCADPTMIFDMEANDGKCCETDGRTGFTMYFNDGSGSQWPLAGGSVTKFSPLPVCRGTSAVALHTKGTRFTIWGAGVALRFSETGWDASAYAGITFWAMSSTSSQIAFKVATPATVDAAFGGTCQPSGVKACADHFATARQLTPTWTAYPVSFLELRQAGWGVPAASTTIDRSQVMEINIVVAQGAPSFDIWLDDFTFTQ